MTKTEQLRFLFTELTEENPIYEAIRLPHSQEEQKRRPRSLMNVRPPKPVTKRFLEVQDAYLMEERGQKGVLSLSSSLLSRKGSICGRGTSLPYKWMPL